jgi:transcriptional regulator with GAF, ATPase, and Fis domain/tetratricopeptide (TPR) repeat protein
MPLSPGTLVAQRYRLSAPLGRGTQGTVWEAVDARRSGALCAIKFARNASPQHGEFETLLSISHPSLPRALDYGTHEGGTFLVLERIAGRVLDASLDRVTAIRALADVASALATLHEAGLVHGDVKPANVLVAADRAVLVDLGLATRAGLGVPSGTLAFLAPEALAGERGPAMDLYALGVTAALALTGAHPLVENASDRDALLAALAARTAPRDSVIAALPPGVRDAIRSLLLADAAARASSARAWLARFARDAASELTAAQRDQALGGRAPARALRIARIADDGAVDRTLSALEKALGGDGLGVIVSGAPGAGRSRAVDDAMRALLIAHAARGMAPEIVESVPNEATRPTVVRLVDVGEARLARELDTLQRVQRFTDASVPIAIVAETHEAVDRADLANVRVEPLSRDAMRTLISEIAARTPSDAAIDAWLAATAGLAGRAVRLAQALEAESIANATRDDLTRVERLAPMQRLESGLSREGREAALLLAAAGEPMRTDDVARWLGRGPSGVALAELAQRSLAIVRDGSVHLTVRIDLDALTESERARLGAALERDLAAHDAGRVTVRARAALLRNDVASARVHADAAANRAHATPLDRIPWLEILARLSPDDRSRALALATAWITAGEPRRALALLEASGDDAETAAVRAEALRRAGDAGGARALGEQLASDPDPMARATGTLLLARDALDQARAADSLARLGAMADGEGVPPRLEARALETGALAALVMGDTNGARRRVDAGLAVTMRGGDVLARARFLSLSGMVHQQHGDHDAALRAYRDAFQSANDAGDLHAAATYAVNLGAAHLECGSLGEAAHWLTRGVRTLARLGRMKDLAGALANLASLHAFVGDRAGAFEHANRAEHAARDASDAGTELFARALAAESSLQGRFAAEALVAVGEAARNAGLEPIADDTFARAAIAYARIGDVDLARDALSRAGSNTPAPIAALAALEIALAAHDPSASLENALERARSSVREQPTVEYEIDLLALVARVAERRNDPSALERARAAHAARVDALANTLPESLAALFRDAHALPSGPVTFSSAPLLVGGAGTDVRWRRLAEITREMNTEQRLRPLLERVMDAIIELTGASRGFLLLRTNEGELKVRTARNIGRRDLGGDDMALSRSVAERVARTGEALLTVDASSDERLDAFESVNAMRLRSILAVPLVVRGDSVGTVYVDDRFRTRAFGDDALEIAREFAEAAAVAIQNARTKVLLRRALHRAERLSRELARRVDAQTVELEATRRALASGAEPSGRYDEIVGRGPAMLRTLQLVDKVAPTAMPVLLLGESGTGKELVARAIHANSPRNGKPFVAENCGAIPETLLESVLFGHVKGAFTGADRTRAGLFEVADGGTLFLDEVGEMSPTMQAKLLRVLQDGEVRPVGGERSRKVDVRVIAATHRDLAEMVRLGKFREDLYYRLAVMVVPIPSLRQRREDLPGLVSHFIEKHAHRKVSVERKAMSRLVAFSWPGNVRQLENEIMRACVLADGTIREEDLSPAMLAAPVTTGATDTIAKNPLDLRAAIDTLERDLIERAMRQHGGNQSRAAKALGLSRFGLQKKLKRLAQGATAGEPDEDEAAAS